jgi:hypothetical protein
MPKSRRPAAPVAAELLEEAVRTFAGRCRRPVVQEAGEEAFPLLPDRHEFGRSAGKLLLSAWDEVRNWNRRVVGVADHQAGRLTLVIEKFGGRQGEAWLYDADRPEALQWDRRGGRRIVREQFRRMLLRSFTGWEIEELSTEQDLEHTLSANYPRALIRQGKRAWAAILAPPEAPHALSFGLIWLDYVRRRFQPKLTVEGLALYLPAQETQAIALRLRWLDPAKALFQLFAYSPNGETALLDLADCGNLHTTLDRCQHSILALPDWVAQLAAWPHVERVSLAGGAASFRILGLEFARWRDGELRGGFEDRRLLHPRDLPELRAVAAELANLRQERGSLLERRSPEAWLEMRVRESLSTLDARLCPEPVYGQVPAMAGVDRGIADLLAIERSGRLAVLEIKASEDVHLPLQALDYWMRVAWHVEAGDFTACGYFPGHTVANARPRLLLIAPALEFHPTTETILGFFSSVVPVERLGVGLEWRQELRLLFRLHGAARPA